MTFIYQYAARIFDDLLSGYNYYLEQASVQVADNFIADIESTIKKIKNNPYTYSKRYNDIRCGIPKKYPYMIHYRIIESESVVMFIAVANTNQKPLWK